MMSVWFTIASLIVLPGIQVQVTAEAAVTSIEAMERYEGVGIGFAGAPGSTYTALKVIVALGPESTRYLRRLTGSSNPVARVAGIVGFGLTNAPEAYAVLEALTQDDASLNTFEGCIMASDTVAGYARETLRRLQRVKPQ